MANSFNAGVLFLFVFWSSSHAETPFAAAKLQIINGSNETIDIFWLESDTARVPHGSIAAGKSKTIKTTIGHRFEIVNRENHATAIVTCSAMVQGFRFDPNAIEGVPTFYKQIGSANGLPVVASSTVSPYAVKEAVFLVNQLLDKRPDVLSALIKSGARLCIMAHNEFTTDLPEFAHLAEEKSPGNKSESAKDYWDRRARGTGGSETDPFCSCAEENLLGYPGDPYKSECILIHEFAHCIHLRGMSNVDPTFDSRLKSAYESAMKTGLWKGKYASVNHHEYFAEGVQSWFDNNRSNDHDHNHVDTRNELVMYDPGLASMCREVFGDTILKYTKPETRLTNHLAGYEPASAPTFVWPKRLVQASLEKNKTAEPGVNSAIKKNQYVTRDVSGWSVHINQSLLDSAPDLTELAIKLLQVQLDEIVIVVPATAVAELKKVPLWISPEYPATQPRAEYHPAAKWLGDNNRDPAMAKGVEFTNVRIFEAETRRMPNFALHELAHAFHDRVLRLGFGNPEIKAAYGVAKQSGKYDQVERRDSEGRTRLDRAYAMTSPQEYFAESTEAFFSRNDFFPYNQKELIQHDPEAAKLMSDLWGVRR